MRVYQTQQSMAAASSSTGYERKKRNLTAIPISSPLASSSSHRFGHQHSAGLNYPARHDSPPASAYFPLLSADSQARLRPVPDAEQHFAYSTQLRRHQSESAAVLSSPAAFANVASAEAQSLWSRALNAITGRDPHQYQPLDNGRQTPPSPHKESKDTASGKFAHYTIEVRTAFPLSNLIAG